MLKAENKQLKNKIEELNKIINKMEHQFSELLLILNKK